MAVTPHTYYYFKVTDNDEKNYLTLALKAQAPLGTFLNPAPIASLPFTGSITVGAQACEQGMGQQPGGPLPPPTPLPPPPTHTRPRSPPRPSNPNPWHAAES